MSMPSFPQTKLTQTHTVADMQNVLKGAGLYVRHLLFQIYVLASNNLNLMPKLDLLSSSKQFISEVGCTCSNCSEPFPSALPQIEQVDPTPADMTTQGFSSNSEEISFMLC